jgi:hypothetical protein
VVAEMEDVRAVKLLDRIALDLLFR